MMEGGRRQAFDRPLLPGFVCFRSAGVFGWSFGGKGWKGDIPMGTTFIHCQWLLSMAEGQEPMYDAYLKIVDDKIAEVGPWQEAMIEPGAEVIS